MSVLARLKDSLKFRITQAARFLFYPILVRTAQKKLVNVDQPFVDSHGGTMLYFGAEEWKHLPPPIYQTPHGAKKVQAVIGEHHWEQPYVAVVRDVVIANVRNAERTANPFGRTREGHILHETTHARSYLQRELQMPFHLDEIYRIATNHPWRTQEQAQKLDLAFSLAYEPHRNYYHWHVDILPRLEGLMLWEQQTGEQVILLVGEKLAAWQIRGLELLGFSQDRFVHLAPEGAHIERLIVPSFRNKHFLPAPLALAWLRGQLLDRFPVDPEGQTTPPYLYVTRRNAIRRRILNEDAVIGLLEPLGFQVVDSASIPTLDEEIALFRGARIIAGPMGAGLVNMLFAESSVILDLMPLERQLNHSYYGLASTLGFPYAYVNAVDLFPQEDFMVDLDLFRQALEVVLRTANP